MNCKIPRYAREGIVCPVFNDTNDCWYEYDECKHVKDIDYGAIWLKQIEEDK